MEKEQQNSKPLIVIFGAQAHTMDKIIELASGARTLGNGAHCERRRRTKE